MNGDGIADIVYAAGDGGAPRVVVVNGADGTMMRSFFAYDESFRNGAMVSVGDVDGDGFAVIVTGAGAGGAPHVKVFSGKDGSLLASFFAYDADLRGGVNVAAADVDGDGRAEIITGAGAGGAPHVRVIRFADLSEVTNFFAYDSLFRGGVFVAAGDLDGDGRAEVVTGAGPGGGPHVYIFDPEAGQVKLSIMAFEATFSGGVWVGVGDPDADGGPSVLAAAGPTDGPRVMAFDPITGAVESDQFFDDPQFAGGVYVS